MAITAGTAAALASAGASAYGAYKGGKGGKGGKQQTSSEPWKEVQPYLKDIYGAAQKQFREHQPQFYPGQTFAPFDPLQTAAQQMAAQYITGSPSLPAIQPPPGLPQSIPNMGPNQGFRELPMPEYQYEQPGSGLYQAPMIQELFRRNLGRQPRQSGLSYWLDQLAHGAPMSTIESSIMQSPEARRRQP